MDKKFLRFLASLLAVGLVLTSCSNSEESSSDTTGSSEAPEAPETDQGDSVLRFANVISANSLSPHDDQSPATFNIYTYMYEGLVRQNPVDGSIEPWLASGWEVSNEGKAIVFTLNEGITFSDGEPLNAEAIKANIDFIKSANPEQVLPPVAAQLQGVESVEALDEFNVRFNLSGPGEGLLLSTLSRNAGLVVSPKALESSAKTPIGTGPYVFDEANSESDLAKLTFDANENYWREGEVGFGKVEITTIVDPQARLDAFNSGQYDVSAIDLSSIDDVQGSVTKAATVRIGFVVTDWKGQKIPQLANRDVRCAMAQALNSKGIQEQIGSPGSELDQFALDSDDYAYVADLDVPEFDIEAAKKAFAETGESGFSFVNPHLPIDIFPATSSAYAGALNELGIEMENQVLDPPSGGNMFATLAKGSNEVMIIPFNEPNALMSLIARTGKAQFNPSGESPEGVDELVTSARGKSLEDAEEEVAAAWKIMLEECIFIMNSQIETAIAYSDGVTGVVHTKGLPMHFYPQNVRPA